MTRRNGIELGLCGALLIAGLLIAAGPAQAELVSHWTADGTSADCAGSNHGTLMGGAGYADGILGQGFALDGSGAWVEVPHDASLGFPAGTSFSISVWYQGSQVNGALVGKNYEDYSQVLPWYLLWSGGDGSVNAYLRSSSGSSYKTASTPVSDGAWHHVAATADASSGLLTLYIDGEVSSQVAFDTASGYGTTPGVLHFGRHYDRFTTGTLDEIMIFSHPLTAAEVAAEFEVPGSLGGTPDSDGDGVPDDEDICEGFDDAADADGDGIPDGCDDCPVDVENDADGDGICEVDDNCPSIPNANQANADGDQYGDACEPDDDADGVIDDDDNCPMDWNADQADYDGDGLGDVCDADSDGDGVADGEDVCLGTAPGAPVLSNGCSVDQECPCDAPWKNHGGYVSCVAHASEWLLDAGLITDAEKDALCAAAGQSECGRTAKKK